MNILLIFSINEVESVTKPLYLQEQMQFGISYISAILRQHKYHTDLLILSRQYGKKNKSILKNYITTFSPDIICFTSVSSEFNFICRMGRYVQLKFPGIFLVIGGAHVTLNPSGDLLDIFNALCIGEGEYPVLELADKIKHRRKVTGIQNLWLKTGEGIEKNPPRPFIADLDALPFPDRNMWQKWINDQKVSRHSVLLGRGCPFTCTYCCNHAFRKVAGGRYVRFRSPADIIEEIRQIVRQFPGTREIYLEVETILLNDEWALRLCDGLRLLNEELDIQLTYETNIRITPQKSLKELFEAFSRCKLKTINIGIESGSERIRSQVLKRHYSNSDIYNTVKLARKYNLKVKTYNLIGLPEETITDIEETIKVNRHCQPDRLYTSVFYPYPGTKLYNYCLENKLMDDVENPELERFSSLLKLPGITRQELEKIHIWFDYYVFKGKKPIFKILLKVLIWKIRAIPQISYLLKQLTASGVLLKMRQLIEKYTGTFN